MDFKIVGFTLGILLTILGWAELIPAFLEWSYMSADADVFFFNALICMFFGGFLIIANKSYKRQLTIKQTFLLTTISWVTISFFASLPLYMSTLNISFTDAFFEATSGITTTGSTVLSRLDSLSYGVLLWRSIIQWIGGIGLVAFAIIALPSLHVGGMQLFQTESSDTSDKIIPRSATVMKYLVFVYVFLTALCGLSYYFEGMSAFDALNHALTTIPTGGFSTHDASFGYFESISMQLTATLFMFLGGVPFILYIRLLYRNSFSFFKDEQTLLYSGIIFVLTFILTSWLINNTEINALQSFTYAIFNIVSVLTTTGFATTDYTLWGPFATILFFFLTYVGACAGSTTGGLKMMRVSIVAKAMMRQINTLIHPNGLFILRYQKKPVNSDLVTIILGFSGLYVLSNVFLTLALALLGLDFTTAVSGAATAIANVGPGIGDIIGPAGNFSTLPDTAKWLLCAGMLIGRLEIITVLVLFTPHYMRF